MRDRFVHTVDGAKERRLPTTRWANQRGYFLWLDVQGHIVDRAELVVEHLKILQVEASLRRLGSCISRPSRGRCNL